MSTRIRVTVPAQRQAKRAMAWWKKNRPAAPNLLRQEIKDALDLLKASPEIGASYECEGIPSLRRRLLPRTRYHLYYVYDDKAAQIVVLALWSCLRGRDPPLRLA